MSLGRAVSLYANAEDW